jgi:hypothetical protein
MDDNWIDKSGFYKQVEDGSWMYAQHFVYGPDFELLRELKDTYTYPVDGWYWFETEPIIQEN